MQEIIKTLKFIAKNNIENGQDPNSVNYDLHGVTGVIITNILALKIVGALEVATYPPAVRAVLSLIEYLELNGRLNKGFDYIAVDNDGYIYEYDAEPIFGEKMWNPRNEEKYLRASIGENNIGRTLLFHRTDNGWEWLGNKENTLNKTT